MKKLVLLFMMVSAVPISYASENSVALNQHVGPYADINVGRNMYNISFYSSWGSKSETGFYGFGWSAAGGYNFTNIIGLEGGFMQNYLKTYNSEKATRYVHVNAPYVATRLTFPIGNRFSLIGKVGAMNAGIPRNNSVILPYVSVGASVALTHSLDLEAQYQGAVYGVINAGLLGAGLVYHF